MKASRKNPGPVGGVQAAAELLASLDRDGQERLLASIAEQDPGLADELRRRMFTFEDVGRLEPPLLQKLLQSAPRDRLALALRGANDELCAALFQNMSKRAVELLREEIMALGPQKRADVERARRELAELARKLRDAD